jgi:hypothetical protein
MLSLLPKCANRREGYEDLPGFEVDLNIKPGLKWSDGEDARLNDMRYTWEWNMDPDNVGLYAGTDGWNIIDRFDVAEDGLTATVHFCTAFTASTASLASRCCPEHYMSNPVTDAARCRIPWSGIENADLRVPSSSLAPAPAPSSSSVTSTGSAPTLETRPTSSRRVRFFDGAKDAHDRGLPGRRDGVATDLLQGDYAAIIRGSPDIGGDHQACLGI